MDLLSEVVVYLIAALIAVPISKRLALGPFWAI
jgi:Kef-type K+ transport system membrane component KefB